MKLQDIGIGQLVTTGSNVVVIILAFLWLDNRIEAYSQLALIDAKIDNRGIAVADLTSTIGRYNAFEQVGALSDENRIRRDELISLRDIYLNQVATLSSQRTAIAP